MATCRSLPALLVVVPLVMGAETKSTLVADPAEPVACIESWPEVQQHARGFDHFVHLLSRCPTPARCEVSSDSNPAPIRVVVPPHHTTRVLVAHGSPAPTFVPHVACRFRPTARPE